jgi:hypothetical protein
MKIKILIGFLFVCLSALCQSSYTVYKSDISVQFSESKQGKYAPLKRGATLSTKAYLKSVKGKIVLIENSTKKVYSLEIVGTKKITDFLKNKTTDKTFESNLMQTLVNSFIESTEAKVINRNGISQRGNEWLIFKDMPKQSFFYIKNNLLLNFQSFEDSIQIQVRQFNKVIFSVSVLDSNFQLPLSKINFDENEKLIIEVTKKMNKEKLEVKLIEAFEAQNLEKDLLELSNSNNSADFLASALLYEKYKCGIESIQFLNQLKENDVTSDFLKSLKETLVNSTIVLD